MTLAQKPQPLTMSTQMSVRTDPVARRLNVYASLVEDGCTVGRSPLRITDPGLWCAAGILAVATLWIAM